jgi:hypothetical protein
MIFLRPYERLSAFHVEFVSLVFFCLLVLYPPYVSVLCVISFFLFICRLCKFALFLCYSFRMLF